MMLWTVIFLDTAKLEADALPDDLLARLLHLADLIRNRGLDKLPPQVAKHLKDDLWELRLKGKDGIARALYVTRIGRRLVIVRVFVKKTQKTPPREIRLALKRAKDQT